MRWGREVVRGRDSQSLRFQRKVRNDVPLGKIAAQHSRLAGSLLRRKLDLSFTSSRNISSRNMRKKLSTHSATIAGMIRRHLQNLGDSPVRLLESPRCKMCDKGSGIMIGMSALVRVRDDRSGLKLAHHFPESLQQNGQLVDGFLIDSTEESDSFPPNSGASQRGSGLLRASTSIGITRSPYMRSPEARITWSTVREKDNHAILQPAQQRRGPDGFIVRMRSQEEYPQRFSLFLISILSGQQGQHALFRLRYGSHAGACPPPTEVELPRGSHAAFPRQRTFHRVVRPAHSLRSQYARLPESRDTDPSARAVATNHGEQQVPGRVT